MPGLWTVPFGTGDEEFYRQHRRWFLHDPDGQPMRNWCGNYVLDPSQPAVLRHMEQSHRRMAQWGYDFFKIDGLFGGSHHYSAHFYERPDVRAAFRLPCEDPLARAVQALRRGLGPAGRCSPAPGTTRVRRSPSPTPPASAATLSHRTSRPTGKATSSSPS